MVAYVPRARRETERDEEASLAGVTLVQGEEDLGGVMLEDALRSADLVVDALLGIGQERALMPDEPIGVALATLRARRDGYAPPKLVAADLPTGVNADTGDVDSLTVPPDLSVTFGLQRWGCTSAREAPLWARSSDRPWDPEGVAGGRGAGADDVTLAEVSITAAAGGRQQGHLGKLLVVGGSRRLYRRPGLAATAAYRQGAGLVTIACPELLVPALAPAHAEATWLPLETADDGHIRGEAAMALRGEGGGSRRRSSVRAWAT